MEMVCPSGVDLSCYILSENTQLGKVLSCSTDNITHPRHLNSAAQHWSAPPETTSFFYLTLHPFRPMSKMENLPAKAKTHIVPAAKGYAFEVNKGDRFRIVDIHGLQIVDFVAWVNEPGLKEHVRMSYTRFSLQGVVADIGESLLTNHGEPALRVIADTVKVHDMTFMSCYPELYAERGVPGHRSCTMNITEAMEPYGITTRLQLPDPLNLFQNSPNYTLKSIGCSKPGDYIEFEAQKDLVCGLSCCPWVFVRAKSPVLPTFALKIRY